MPPSPAYAPDPRYAAFNAAHAGEYADAVAPAAFPARVARYRNQRWAARIGLDALDDAEWEAAFARFAPLASNMSVPLAMRYHGHQFGVYNPELGDGRGFLYAQLRDDRGRLLDLATKGSGRTPYSRTADGRLTLKGGVREVLAASLLEAQGVYTSKAFALYETGESLVRHDEPSPTRAGVLTRLSHSHIRFGTFQRLAYLKRAELIEPLIAHCGDCYYPEILALEGPARTHAFYARVIAESARLAASWMAAGFVHGVLNTDNMTVCGESFDYGPWRFLPACIPSFTAAYFDEAGRYAYGRQPEAVAWNLAQLGGAIASAGEREALNTELARYAALYREALCDKLFARLGVARGDLAQDARLAQELLFWLSQTEISWPQFFHDWFCLDAGRAARSPLAAHYETPAFAAFRTQLEARGPVQAERLAHPIFARETPVSLVIEEVEAVWAPIAEHDDWSALETKLADIEALREALALDPGGPV
ncbi:MAG: protein adenylyltransferase SelO family protein [Hyphomonadaceae bacterium]